MTLGPPPDVCLPCWMFTHNSCDRRATCACASCYPHRRPPSEGDEEPA